MPAENRKLHFEKLFREHYQSLASYACSILKNEQDAEDVVQEIFIRVWQNSPEVINSEGFKYYMITAVRNGCISLIRKQARTVAMENDNISFQRTEPEMDDEQPVDLMEKVKEALDRLPPQCLAIFRLSRFGKLTYSQIAAEMGISVKTVENQMGKALRLMREFAKEHRITLSSAIVLFILGVAYIFQGSA